MEYTAVLLSNPPSTGRCTTSTVHAETPEEAVEAWVKLYPRAAQQGVEQEKRLLIIDTSGLGYTRVYALENAQIKGRAI